MCQQNWISKSKYRTKIHKQECVEFYVIKLHKLYCKHVKSHLLIMMKLKKQKYIYAQNICVNLCKTISGNQNLLLFTQVTTLLSEKK